MSLVAFTHAALIACRRLHMTQNRLHAMTNLDLSPLRLDSVAHSDQLHIGVAHARWLHTAAGYRFHTASSRRRHPPLPRTDADLARVTRVSCEYEFTGDIGDDNNDMRPWLEGENNGI